MWLCVTILTKCHYSHLIGASKLLATVTITSVPKTQKISYINSPDNKIHPVAMLFKCSSSTALMANARPNKLLATQCFCSKYHAPTKEQLANETTS